MTTNDTLPQRVGHNLRRLRGDHSQTTVAETSQQFGAGWRSGHISHQEAGEFKATHEVVALLQLTLTTLLERPVALGELLGYDSEYLPDSETGEVDSEYWGANQPFELAPGFEVLPSDYLRFLHEDNPQLLIKAANELATLRARFNPSAQEVRIANKLGVDALTLHEYSKKLWGKGFEQARDQLAGAGASPQRKGRYSVQLLEQLREELGRG